MNGKKQIIVKVDGYTRACLTAIAGLLTVLILALWAQVPLAGKAEAVEGIVTGAEQRSTQIDIMKENTAKLTELIQLFKDGEAKVTIVQKEKDK